MLLLIIILGVSSFIVLTVFDFLQLKYSSWVWIAGLMGAFLFISAVALSIYLSPTFFVPYLIRILGGIVFSACLVLLVSSFFLELPFSSTYVSSNYKRKIICSGTYALCRHPGVLWLAVGLLALVMVTGSKWLAAAAPLWVICDIVYVWVQENYIFGQMFKEYEKYQENVPFLVPTKESFNECICTFKKIFKER